MLTTKQPKAGQGMNFGFLDAQNFAWKLHLVESGFLKRSVLKTYEEERRLMAQKLIDFDAKYATLFSSRPPSTANVESAEKEDNEKNNEFVKAYKQAADFTSGYGVEYGHNCLNWETSASKWKAAMSPTVKLIPGRVFPTATVNRVFDAHIVHLEQEIPQNGSYRIFVFAGTPSTTSATLADFATSLEREDSFFSTYRRSEGVRLGYEDRHNPHSALFTFCFVFNEARSKLEARDVLPGVLEPYRYHLYSDDAGPTNASVHAKLGVNADEGGVIMVRPDGYVACLLPLEGSKTVDVIDRYFRPITAKAMGHTNGSVSAS